MSDSFSLVPAERPLLVSVPHSGTLVPEGILSRMTTTAASLPDTDWFVDRLYRWAGEMGAGLICANHSRFVVDLNRPPDNENLYSGETTGLVPARLFSGEAVYVDTPPDNAEVQQRVQQYWQPYHQAIERELTRLKSRFGRVVLFDAHSIASNVPRLFEGRLPDLCLGTWDGRSASPELESLAANVLGSNLEYSSVVNGRFKGGFITRHYGRPQNDVHALQLEMSQSVYLDEETGQWDPKKVKQIRPHLTFLLESIMRWAEADD